MLFQHLVDLINHRVELITRFHFFALGFVFGSVRFGVLRHALDFLLAQT